MRGRELKLSEIPQTAVPLPDAPYAGARIETSLNWQSLQRIVMPLMRGRELKH